MNINFTIEVNEQLKGVKFDSKETSDIEFSFLDFFYTSLQMKTYKINNMQTVT